MYTVSSPVLQRIPTPGIDNCFSSFFQGEPDIKVIGCQLCMQSGQNEASLYAELGNRQL